MSRASGNQNAGGGIFKMYPDGSIYYAGNGGTAETHGSGAYIAKNE